MHKVYRKDIDLNKDKNIHPQHSQPLELGIPTHALSQSAEHPLVFLLGEKIIHIYRGAQTKRNSQFFRTLLRSTVILFHLAG